MSPQEYISLKILLKNWLLRRRVIHSAIKSTTKRSKHIDKILLVASLGQYPAFLLSNILNYLLGAIIICFLVYQYNVPDNILHTWKKQLSAEKRYFLRTSTSIISLIPYSISFIVLQNLGFLPKLINPSLGEMLGSYSYFFNLIYFFVSFSIMLSLILVFTELYHYINSVIISDIGGQARLNFQIVLISIWVLSAAIVIGGDLIITLSTSLVVFITIIKTRTRKQRFFSLRKFTRKKQKMEQTFWDKWNLNIVKSDYSFILFSIFCIALLWIFINYRFFCILISSKILSISLVDFPFILPSLLMILSGLAAAHGVIKGADNWKSCYPTLTLFSFAMLLGFLFPTYQPIYFFLYHTCDFSSFVSIVFTELIQGLCLCSLISFYFLKIAKEAGAYSYNSLRKLELTFGIVIIGFFGVLANLYIGLVYLIFPSEYELTSFSINADILIFVIFPVFLYIFTLYTIEKYGMEWISITEKTTTAKEAKSTLYKELERRKNHKRTKQDNRKYIKKTGIIWLTFLVFHILFLLILNPFPHEDIFSLVLKVPTFFSFLVLIILIIPPISLMSRKIG